MNSSFKKNVCVFLSIMYTLTINSQQNHDFNLDNSSGQTISAYFNTLRKISAYDAGIGCRKDSFFNTLYYNNSTGKSIVLYCLILVCFVHHLMLIQIRITPISQKRQLFPYLSHSLAPPYTPPHLSSMRYLSVPASLTCFCVDVPANKMPSGARSIEKIHVPLS